MDSTFTSEIIETDCGYDTFYYAPPKEDIDVIPVAENSPDTASIREDTAFNNITRAIQLDSEKEKQEFERKGYEDILPQQGMYQFEINSSGWHNIDVLYNNTAAAKVQLFAKIQMQEATDVSTYLCIPKRKILMMADKHNKDVYIFHYSDADGYLPMVLNDDAFIFATASVDDKIFYGITKFKIKPQQTVVINIKESGREQILAAFKMNRLDDVTIDIDKREMEIFKKPCEGNPTDNPSEKFPAK